MFSIFKRIYEKWKEFKRVPKIGDIYQYCSRDPFVDMCIEIIDIKDGYVKYRCFPRGNSFWSMSISELKSRYKRT